MKVWNHGGKRVLSFLMAICLLLVMAPVSVLAVTRTATISVGESASFQHYSHYSKQFKYKWEITSGSNCVKITSGVSSDTCTVQGTAAGTATLKGTASRSGYGKTYNYYHTVTLTVNPRNAIMTFDANGGSVDVASVSIYDGCTLGMMPTPVRAGYTFLGWFTQKTGGTQYERGDTMKVTASTPIQMYAHWQEGDVNINTDGWDDLDWDLFTVESLTNTAIITVDGKKGSFDLGTSGSADGGDYYLTFYSPVVPLRESMTLVIDPKQSMWESVSTTDAATKLKSLTIYYNDDSSNPAEDAYYSSLLTASGNNTMKLELKSNDGKHLVGTFSGDVKRLHSAGSHKISGVFSVSCAGTKWTADWLKSWFAENSSASSGNSGSVSTGSWDFDDDDIDFSSPKVTEPCPHCDDGDCRICGGTGYLTKTEYAIFSDKPYEVKMKCGACNHGKCIVCKGKGTITR